MYSKKKSFCSLPRHPLGLLWWLRWLRICPQCRDPGSIPGLGLYPGEGNGKPLQYSCFENPIDRGRKKSDLIE